MRNTILVLFIALTLNGCGWLSRKVAVFTDYSEICVDNVQYLQFTSGASVAYNVDGTVKTCK